MNPAPLHSWDLDLPAATALQRQLADRVDSTRPLPPCRLIAGADISYDKGSPVLFAAVVVLRADTLEVVENAGVVSQATFSYIPGYLSFREAPAVLQAFERLTHEPDVVMLDGQGIAHPRGLGLACHLGLWLDKPTVGCAKSRLVGQFTEPGRERGSTSPLVYHGREVGRVVRTKTGVQPLFVSPGHLADMDSSVQLVLACDGGYRVPEPTRHAHLHVNALRRGEAAPS